MSTPIEVKFRTAAAANAGLTALLGTSPFRWYDTQLVPGTAFPAMVCYRVSAVPLYVNVGQNPLELIRVQITIWEGPEPDTANSLIDALQNFLANFSATTVAFSQNRIVNKRRGLYTDTQPGIFQNTVDVMVWNNATT